MKWRTEGSRVPVMGWVDNIEADTFKQAENLANLPFVHNHVVLLPDCLTDDSEVLTSTGFIKITDLTGKELIANYDKTTKKVSFSQVKTVINRKLRVNEKVYEFNIPMLNKSLAMSENHRVPTTDGVILAKNLPKTFELSYLNLSSAGSTIKEQLQIQDEELCLIAWIVGDGNIKQSNKRKDGVYSSINIRFGLTKDRKVKRICSLLDSLQFRYSVNTSPKQTTISIMVKESRYLVDKYVGISKEYPKHFISLLSSRQAYMFLKECIAVDGDWESYINRNTIRYNTKRQADINFLSSLISLHYGIANDNTRWTEGYKRIKMHYLSAISHNKLISGGNNGLSKNIVVKKEIQYKGKLVCVECESSFFIARQNGMTFVTGNSHLGYGMPIGGVIACKNVIIPHAIGSDIGCGVAFINTKLNLDTITKDTLKNILSEIRQLVPTGVKKHKEQTNFLLNSMPSSIDYGPIIVNLLSNAILQIGTLGSGNHFVELQKNKKNELCVMLHSGSRNLGYKICSHYNTLAVELNEKYYSKVPKNYELAFLPINSIEGKDYVRDMKYCVKYAKANRRTMMHNCLSAIKNVVSKDVPSIETYIDVAHNYARLEHHFNKNVWVHRKGATSAKKDEIGLIPGSQGSASFIVKGKGNKLSFTSCSHGAGRIMSRKKAKNTLDFESEVKQLENKNIIHTIRTIDDLDESTGSYKDIYEVMDNQSDLVDIVEKLTPIACIKGK